MRIGLMIDSYKPYISGVTNQVELSKKYLELAGHEVYVFTFGDHNQKADAKARVIRSAGLPLADTGFYLSWRYSRKAKQLLQTMDLVHVHHPFLSGRLALRYCRPLQIPIVFTYHSRYDLMARAYLPLMPEEMGLSMLQAYMPPFCEAVELVTTPTRGMVQVLRDLKVEVPIEAIPNGIDLKQFQSARPLARADFGFTAEDVLLVYTGRIALEKNIPFLLQSFAGVAQALPHTHLLIIGSGIQSYEEEIKQMAADLQMSARIHFIGKVEYEKLPAYLAMCDIFVTASIAETFGMTNVEAMGAGLPVMGIHSVGIDDIVESEVTGLLATHDLAAFTAKLTRLCLDLSLRRQFGMAARQASSRYAIQNVTETLLGHYRQLAHEAQPRKSSWRTRLRGLIERFSL
ncbi:MAG: glycosyltransferase [Anaerolineales bacterium]|nr:glycosyltransferase [Anaerolineales bacterium]